MSICVLCSRTFGSDQALRQHEEDSPKHGTFDCKACKRSFSSQDALTQHQDDSPVHQRSRRDSVTASATPVPFTQYVPLLSSTSSNVPSATHDGQRSRDTATENSSQIRYSTQISSHLKTLCRLLLYRILIRLPHEQRLVRYGFLGYYKRNSRFLSCINASQKPSRPP